MRPTDELDAWAASGAMWLTGRSDGPPLGPPVGLVADLRRHAAAIAGSTRSLGTSVTIDPIELLTERAALRGFERKGRTSCGGATKLLATADEWLAVSLARPDDMDLLPAWLGSASVEGDAWEQVEEAATKRSARDLVRSGTELGLPVALLGESRDGSSVEATRHGDGPGCTTLEELRVIDLSALWAGPLCGSLFADAGADVVKVESTTRPDGARAGDLAFYDLLNAGKRSVALDLRTNCGRSQLTALIRGADMVIEASRPRALEQFGIDAVELLSESSSRTRVWVSITAHGRTGEGRERVGFGDDTAAAGGLIAQADDGPVFCADAIADPATGIVATAAALDALASEGSWLLDVAMSGVAASLAGTTIQPNPDDERPADPPVSSRDRGSAATLGQHTDEVLAAVEQRS